MATLEDAAEELVVRLRGLDSEIEESEGKLEDLRDQVDKAAEEVEQEWSQLREAVSSLLEMAREQGEQLGEQARETGQALVDARSAVGEEGAESRQELGEGRAHLDALGQHAAGLEPGVESLATEAGEAPARSLAERARELEQELNRLMEEARTFLQDEVAGAATEIADEIRQICQTLHQSLAEAITEAFQDAYQQWESAVDELESYVITQGYDASHDHARAVVEYAVEECDQACNRRIDEVREIVGVMLGQLKELAAEVEHSAERVVEKTGAALLEELNGTHKSATAAVAALDRVKQELTQYSFVEV